MLSVTKGEDHAFCDCLLTAWLSDSTSQVGSLLTSLPLLIMGYWTSVHESTGFSLNEMMLEREASFHLIWLSGKQNLLETVWLSTLPNWVTKMGWCSLFLQSPEEEMYLLQVTLWWSLLVKRMRDVLYCIQKGSKWKPRVVHRDCLKTYCEPTVPDWLSEGSASKTETSRVSENPVTISSPGPTSSQSVAVESRTAQVPNPFLSERCTALKEWLGLQLKWKIKEG